VSSSVLKLSPAYLAASELASVFGGELFSTRETILYASRKFIHRLRRRVFEWTTNLVSFTPSKMASFIDMTGRRINRLTVLKKVPNPNGTESLWLCVCVCGNKVTAIGSDIRKGRTKSCGCFRREATIARSTRHGQSGSAVFHSWVALRQRCKNPRATAYPWYGGRGITFTKRWDTFAGFVEDMGNPGPGWTIDRIDNNKGYNKENCRWVRKIEQARNRRSCVQISYRGKTQNVTEWAHELGIDPKTLSARIRRGWPPNRALTTPLRLPRSLNDSPIRKRAKKA
jgi:hypothetical protein